jgi:hypothetical protein
LDTFFLSEKLTTKTAVCLPGNFLSAQTMDHFAKSVRMTFYFCGIDPTACQASRFLFSEKGGVVRDPAIYRCKASFSC